MSEVEVQVHVRVGEAGVGVVTWDAPPGTASDALSHALGAACDDMLVGRQLRRLEISVPASDADGRRAALRTGFRLEGTRRQAIETTDGYADVLLLARLAGDQVYGPSGFSGVMNSALPRTRLIAHVVITDDRGRVLLCETSFKRDWELPGGIVERGEPPRVGANRELVEELGRRTGVGRLLLVDWMPPYLGWDDAVELLFDGGTITEPELAGLELQPSEIVQVRLCTLDEAAALVTPLSHRRLSVALGLGTDGFAYLENGSRPQ